MAKTSSIEKNKKRLELATQAAPKRAKLKAIIKDQSIRMDKGSAAALQLAAMPRNSAKVRVRNRCEVSGRPRAYYRKLKMSRIALRQLGNLGLIPGLVKSSW